MPARRWRRTRWEFRSRHASKVFLFDLKAMINYFSNILTKEMP